MFRTRNCLIFLLLLSFTVVMAAISACSQIQVLERKRLGNQTEDITFVTNGPWANYVAIADAYQVAGIHPGKPPRILFGVQGLGIRTEPRGIAYMSSEGLFALEDGNEVSTLYLVNSQGQSEGTRTIEYLNGYLPDFLEGLAYIPKSSPIFPDDLIVVANGFSVVQVRLEIMRRSGQVVNEILLDPVIFPYVTGVAYHAPNRILVSQVGNQIWDLDLQGNIVAGPVTLDGTGDIEGLVQESNGDVVAADYCAGKLFFRQRSQSLTRERSQLQNRDWGQCCQRRGLEQRHQPIPC